MRQRGRWVGPLLVLVAAASAAGQTPAARPGPSFDVVSIRRNTAGGRSSALEWRPDGSLMVVNQEVRSLINRAFMDVSPVAAIGLPEWAIEDAYDIQARASLTRASADDEAALLRSLLVDRFNLAFHVEPREYDVY